MVLPLNPTSAAIPVTTDSRIKTFVYSENEVFSVTIYYGYQTNIEFSKDEEIHTISMGNSYSWKITPVGRRLFIKALEGGAHTNMTIITTKRTYQFDLYSKSSAEGLDADLAYVIRFFYPTKSFDTPAPTINTQAFKPPSLPQANGSIGKNYHYTLMGPEIIAPLQIFDDGTQTYLKFPNKNALIPHIFIIDNNGNETRANYSREGDFIVINQVARRMVLKLDPNIVTIFNEQLN